MHDIITYEITDNIAVVTMTAKPINGLNLILRQALLTAYQRAYNDSAIEAIVLTSRAKLFSAGADINEFGELEKLFMAPSLPELCCILEESQKPIIAAINGAALGGGLELALACDYRISLPTVRLGLPEVNLGIIPGAGGTQRLPRIGGVQLALNMITSGRPINAEQAEEAGIIDHIHKGSSSFIDAAILYAKELVFANKPVKSCAEMSADTSELSEDYFTQYKAGILQKKPEYYAPSRCVDAVEAACTLPFDQGLKKEMSFTMECFHTPQARALQHLFFAERASTTLPNIEPNTEPREITKVAIIGSGTMGVGIAMNYLNAGIETTILDLNAEALERGIVNIQKNYEVSAKKGRMTGEQVEQRMALLQATTSYDDLADVDLVIEAVFEDMEIKKKVFASLDKICKPSAILATNTSTLDINDIAKCTSRPENVIGLHFFSPANVMRLLEIVRAEKTADDVVITVIKMAKAIKKSPVIVGVCFGFVGNRMIEPYLREASRLMLEGANPEQIDTALTNFGFAMGPAAMSDLAGIDVGYLVRQTQTENYARDPSYHAIGDKLYEMGRFGQKTGRGYYLYEGREKHADPDVVKTCAMLAQQHGIERREISDQEIIERCLYLLINEGAHILQEAIAARSGDCDLIYVNGYGFPIWRGGPMQYADEIGLKNIVKTIDKYNKKLGSYGKKWFLTAPLLRELANKDKTLNEYTPL